MFCLNAWRNCRLNATVTALLPRAKAQVLSGHSDTVTCLAQISPAGYVASGSADQSIIIWDPFSGQKLAQLTSDPFAGAGHSTKVNAIVPISGQRFVSGASQDTAIIWDATVTPPQKLGSWPAHLVGIFALTATIDGKHVISGGADNLVKVL
jgi:WD40 repeat protein